MKNILITGANRGIGLMFAQSFADIVNTVYATARDLNNCDELKKIKNIEILELDLLDKNSIKSFCAEVKDIPFDLILNNAGTFQDEQMEETNLDPELWLDEIMINAIGPITLTQKLKENLMSGVDKKVVFISSQMGSIDDNYSGGYYFYRTSKSALNSAAKSLSIDWKANNIAVLMLHPGWVKTDMGGSKAKLEISESVTSMMHVIESFDISKTGSFVNYDGKKARMVESNTLPDHYNDIDKIYDEIWSRLKIGKKDRNSEFHQCYVASSGNEFPSVRTVVLRHVDKDLLTIGFHTDIRSSKINDIKTNSNVTVLLYDHAAKIQLKINGIAEINHKNANTKAVWSNIRDFSKKCYLVKNAPGTESSTPISGYPEQYEDMLPSPEELELGYENFTYVNINIKAIEWLYLHQNGHRRAKFTISKTNIDKQWIAP